VNRKGGGSGEAAVGQYGKKKKSEAFLEGKCQGRERGRGNLAADQGENTDLLETNGGSKQES